MLAVGNSHKKYIITVALFLISVVAFSQNDCVDAIIVCGNSGFQDLTATGVGKQELSGSNNCSSQENNSLWLKININAGGTLGFVLTPTNANGSTNTNITIDFDFFIFGPNVNCGNIGQAIRCSTTNPQAASQGDNLTGMNSSSSDVSEGPGAAGNSFVNWLNVNSGDSYFIVIDRPIGTSNFKIDWTGTATFNEPPVLNNPPTGISYNIEECDGDGVLDKSTEFDLTVNTPFLIGTQSDVSVSYHVNNNDAQTGNNSISNASNFINTSDPQAIYARVENDDTECFIVTQFLIEIKDTIDISTSDMIQCDDDNNGLWNFDLSLNDSAIIDGVSDTQVIYFESELNANNNIDPIVGLHENNGNPQVIWARLQSTVGGCFGVDSFTIEVFDTPIATQPLNMILCDDDNNGIMEFDLRLQDGVINSASGMSITYHSTQLDAETGATSNPLSSPYESGTTIIYARVENDIMNSCYATTSFDIEVYDSAFPLNTIDPLVECDNTSVGTDIDGFIVFDLTLRESDILNGQNTGFTLTYFTDSSYVTTTQIPVGEETVFQNTSRNQTIYVRMTNDLNIDCFTDISFEIEVFEKPIVNSPSLYSQCDDAANDGVALFNLTLDSIKQEIAPNYISENLIFAYYRDQTDAENEGVTIPTPEAYESQNAFTLETIWIRIQNPNGCFRLVSINLEVTPSSTTLLNYNPTSLYQCDDGIDLRDGIATFDLTSIQSHISTIIFPTITISIDFYENQNDAELENNKIVDIVNHQNINSLNQQDIWVRIKSDLGNNCLGLKNFPSLLIVEELPTANKPTDLTECDDDGDGEFPFATSMVESEVLGSQSLADVIITYFNEDGTTADGSALGTSLPDPFLTDSQTITIVVTNNITSDPDGACSELTNLTFVVDVSPIATSVIIPPLCDNNPNNTGGISIFDTTTLERDILTGQSGMNVFYTDASGNPLRDSNGVEMISPFPSSFSTTTQTITVAVENSLNVTCIASTTVDFIVLPNPEFDLEEETLVCENMLPHRISVENPNQSNYTYQWFNSLGVEIGTDQVLSITNIDDLTADGVEYSVTVSNPSTNCFKTQTILVKGSSIATITEDNIVTTEFNSPGNSIEIDTTNLGSGDYEYSLEHDYDYQPFQDEPIFTGLHGGVYTLLINDKNGCGETELSIVILDYPKFLTPNNDGNNDTWKLIGIESTNFTISPIQIFDRFGKIVAVLDPLSSGWDGYYNGTQLPASDYWFRVQLTDSEGKILDEKGHFSLVRR